MAFSARRNHYASRNAPDYQALRKLSPRILRTSQLNFRQNFGTVGGNGNGVLKMRRMLSIRGDNGPAVFEDFDLIGSQIDHRLDGENETRLDFRTLAVLDIIQ